MNRNKFKVQASSGRISDGGLGFGLPLPLNALELDPSAKRSRLSYVQEPIDFSVITEPSVIVLLRNLQKKESVTKAKALEDLLRLTEASPAWLGEESFLSAWTQLYPRLSIDNTVPTRRLSHQLHESVVFSAKKSYAKHMSDTLPSWLVGGLDNDKSVGQAARSGLARVFEGEQKQHALWLKYALPLITYSQDVLFEQSALTLSDERTTTPDDATSKYSRAAGGGMQLLGSLINQLSTAELQDHASALDTLVRGPKLWRFSGDLDTYLRRSSHRLLAVLLSKRHSIVQEIQPLLAKTFVDEGLAIDQKGTILDFSRALSQLTAMYPEVWLQSTPGIGKRKKRLLKFIQRGSRNSASEYWNFMSQIILKVPSSVLGTEANDASDLLTSIQSGVTAAYEPQVIVSGGWDCYLRVMRFYLSIQPPDQRWAVIQRHWQPIVQSELALKKAEIYRGLSDRAFASTMKDIPSLLTPSQQELFIMQLRDTFEHTLSAVQQLNVAEPKALDRLLHILLTFLTNEQVPGPQSSHFQALADTSKDLIYELIAQVLGLIKKRGGSAQGAAEFLLPKLVEEPLQALVLKSDRLQDLFAGFLEYDLPELLFSDSRSAIVHMLRVMSRSTVQVELFGKTWTSAARHAGSNPDKAMSYQVLGELISALEGQSASQSQFSELIEGVVREATADNSSANFNAIVFLLGNIFSNFGEQLSDTVAHQLLSSLSESIEKKPHDQMAVKKLQLISACSPKLLSDYVITERGSLLVPSLLAQLEIETTHQDATIAILKSLIQYSSQNATQTSGLSHLMARSVVEQILISPDTGIGLLPLIQIARELLAQFADDPVIITQLLITEQDWKRIIGDNLSSTLDPTLVMTNSLQGSVPLVPSDQAVPARGPTLANVAILGRASSYTIELLNETGALREPIATFDKCAMYLVMSAEIMSDALSLKTIGEDNETLATILGARAAFSKSLRASKAEYSAVWSLLTAPLGSIPNSSQTEMNWSYYQARVLTIVAQQIFDKYSFSYVRIEELLRDTNIRRSQDAPHSAAVLLASSPLIQGSAQINKLQNELLNDLTGALSSKDRRGIARLAVLLTIIYDLTEQDDRPLPVSRIVLLLREIFKYCDPGHAEADPIVKFQLIRILSRLSKLTGDGPGGSWEQKTQLLCDTWRGVLDEARMGRPFSFMFDVPLLFATLELYDELHMLSTDNEELHDVLKKAQREAKPSLMRMFLVLNSAPVPHTLPISHTISHLSRATRNLDRISPADYNQLIPLITSHSASVSTAAFVVLHRCIPAAQEQQSIDVALGDSAGSFPPELFPLIISTPETDVIENHTEEEDMDPTLLSFMRTWTLVYDHYRNASFRLRTGYSEQLQKVDQISGLLNTLVSLFTNPATGRLVQIPNGAFQDILHKDLSDNPTVGLLQVYYKTLLHVPVLAKAWYLDLKRGNREIVEQLTEQYVSPNLANEELRAVKAWFEEDQKQTESDGEEQKLVVRVSDNTKEVNLGYEIDDQTMRIMIKLPDAWPLTNVLVESVQRIGVPEEKWQSWLRNTRGVITFSNGSLVDGITAWKENVSGTLKGQSECAICYSIVSSDRQLPTKRCATCKNVFHASCLFKWFKSSNSSSCPLCRTAFQYG